MGYVINAAGNGCFLCRLRGKKDFLLYRGLHALVVLNVYPYNNGHLMVAPVKHKGDLARLTPGEQREVFMLLTASIRILERALRPQGFNVGLNLGRCAGAGVPGHLHFHIVPRWFGDTNFMPATAGIKVIPQSLQELYSLLKPAFDRIGKKSAVRRKRTGGK